MNKIKICSLVFFLSIFFFACSKKNDDCIDCHIVKGCMDPASENFNAQANEDDGSCIDPLEKFIGDYNAVSVCSGGETTEHVVRIRKSEDPEYGALKFINLETYNQWYYSDLNEENEFSFEGKDAFNTDIKASGKFDGDQMEFMLLYQSFDPQGNLTGESQCDAIATKQS